MILQDNLPFTDSLVENEQGGLNLQSELYFTCTHAQRCFAGPDVASDVGNDP